MNVHKTKFETLEEKCSLVSNLFSAIDVCMTSAKYGSTEKATQDTVLNQHKLLCSLNITRATSLTFYITSRSRATNISLHAATSRTTSLCLLPHRYMKQRTHLEQVITILTLLTHVEGHRRLLRCEISQPAMRCGAFLRKPDDG